ncbi:MAG: hypothetical protein EOP36_10175 [Rubrivivax sp.]|nr:MAG: hypothetical protein EOP36_10175 [Rubrivivax sp.]
MDNPSPGPGLPHDAGDFQIVARHLTPTEAHLLRSCLEAAGIPSEVGDVNLVQAHGLLTGAVGGASVRVRQAFLSDARDVMAAYNRGELALDDDFDGQTAAAP